MTSAIEEDDSALREEAGSLDRARLAIGLVSASVIIYEVAITRIMSVLLWYHFAFLSVTLALLGLGAPGVWCSVFPPKVGFLRRALLATAALVPLSVLAMMQAATWSLESPVSLYVIAMLLPLTAAGAAVFRLLDVARGRAVARVYGADLLGAAAGALVVVPLMHFVPTPALIIGSATLALAAAVVVAGRVGVGGAVVAVLIVLSLLRGEPDGWLPVDKDVRRAGSGTATADIVLRRWTPTALITVLKTAPMAFMWGRGSAFRPEGAGVEELGVQLDGSAGTVVARADRPLEEMGHLFFDVTSTGYQLRPPKRVCIIGAGGGRDILTALKAGADHVDAVELSGGLIDILSGPLRERTGDVYHLPGVVAVASEGRSFLSQSEGRYDVIQLSLIDSWAATSAGAFSLSENNLYTVEAYRMYWNRLSPSGFVSTSRWFTGQHQMETVRLAGIAKAALELEGIQEPGRHLALVSAGRVSTLLISRAPLGPEDVDRLDAIAAERGFLRHWPLRPGQEPDALAARALVEGTEAFEAWGFDLQPSTDDRPFFFHTVPLFAQVAEEARRTLSVNEKAVLILRTLLGSIAALAGVLFFLPLVLARRLERAPGFWGGVLYFLAVGLAFMFVEVPWIQRFILFLGHPSHATTVVLSTLLVGAGAGSIFVARVPPEMIRRFGVVLPVVIALVNLSMEPIFHATLSFGFGARVLVSAAILTPAGFLMGMAFPSGLIAFGDRNKAWFWAMNGVASVLASVSSIAFSIELGFTNVLMLGVVFYLLAWLALRMAPGASVGS